MRCLFQDVALMSDRIPPKEFTGELAACDLAPAL